MIEIKQRDGRERDEYAISMALQTASLFEEIPLNLLGILMNDIERGITAEPHRQSGQ